MVREATNTEYLLTRKTAEEYRSKGYEVTEEAPLDFLPGFYADLLARKNDEVKVIEVKSRSSLNAIPQIAELARIIDSKPGWNFELLLVGEPEKVDSPEGIRPFDSTSTVRRVADAEQALASGLPDAAFLLAWSACEAALREMLQAQGVSEAGISSPTYVLDQAVFQGLISRNAYDNLNDMRKYRNAIVHGFSVDGFSDKTVKQLIKTVRRMAKGRVG
jgi:hypothetical protein